MSEPVFTEVQCSCGAIIGSRILAFARAVKTIRERHDGDPVYNYQDEVPFIRLNGAGQLVSSLAVGAPLPSPAAVTVDTTTVIETETESTPTTTLTKTTTFSSTNQHQLVTPVGHLLTCFGAHRDCCRMRLLTAYVYPKNL